MGHDNSNYASNYFMCRHDCHPSNLNMMATSKISFPIASYISYVKGQGLLLHTGNCTDGKSMIFEWSHLLTDKCNLFGLL